jgi:hypothetical protein
MFQSILYNISIKYLYKIIIQFEIEASIPHSHWIENIVNITEILWIGSFK